MIEYGFKLIRSESFPIKLTFFYPYCSIDNKFELVYTKLNQ
jgi:hypothetical protein